MVAFLVEFYPQYAVEVAVALKADALARQDVQRAGFWDEVLMLLDADG